VASPASPGGALVVGALKAKKEKKSSSIDSTVSVLMRRRIHACDMRRRIPAGRKSSSIDSTASVLMRPYGTKRLFSEASAYLHTYRSGCSVNPRTYIHTLCVYTYTYMCVCVCVCMYSKKRLFKEASSFTSTYPLLQGTGGI
jgi:hypothetical protein